MSVQLTIVQGSAADWPLQAQNRGGSTTPTFGSSDTLTATIWVGVDQTALFQPSVSWYTANGTQTGYGQGQVLVSPTAARAPRSNKMGRTVSKSGGRKRVWAARPPASSARPSPCYLRQGPRRPPSPRIASSRTCSNGLRGWHSCSVRIPTPKDSIRSGFSPATGWIGSSSITIAGPRSDSSRNTRPWHSRSAAASAGVDRSGQVRPCSRTCRKTS